MQSSGGWLRDCRGTTVVEAALVIPVLLLTAIGVIEVGRALWIWNQVQFAAEEGARMIMAKPELIEAEHQAALKLALSGKIGGVSPERLTITLPSSPGSKPAVLPIQVVYQYDPIAVSLIGLGEVLLTGRAAATVM